MYKPETPKDPMPFLFFTPLAQLDRVSDYGSDGRAFESLKVYSYKIRSRSRARSGIYISSSVGRALDSKSRCRRFEPFLVCHLVM